MRFEIHWRAAPRYLAIGFALLAYAYLIDHMLTLTLEQQRQLSSADDAQPPQLPDSLN